MPAPGLTGISLGVGKTLIDADSLWQRFAPLGWSKREFHAMLSALNVPWISGPGRHRLVWFECFQLALLTALSVGMPNFLAPGSPQIRKEKGKRFGVTSLDAELFAKTWRETAGILLLSRKLDHDPKYVEALTKDAYEHMAQRISLWLASYAQSQTKMLRKRARTAADSATITEDLARSLAPDDDATQDL